MQDIDFSQYFVYDETSPSCLRWKVDRWKGQGYKQLHVTAGTPAGNVGSDDFYYTVSLDAVKYSVHKIIWQMFHGPIKEDFRVDHFNQIKKDNRISNLRCIHYTHNARNCSMSSSNTSGVAGVTRKNDPRYPGWRATWCDTKGKRREKFFAVIKYGEDYAFELACQYRKKMIDKLNSLGLGYTEHHGLLKKPS